MSKICANCGKTFEPKVTSSGKISNIKYCDDCQKLLKVFKETYSKEISFSEENNGQLKINL